MAKKKTATKSKATTRSKASSKKTTTKKKAVRSKSTARKAASKKPASKKAAVKKAPAKKKPATKKAAVKKAPAKKVSAKKATSKKAAVKKPATKASKAVAKKAVAKKAVSKKAAIKKAPKKAASKKATKAAAPKKPKKKPAPKAKDERYTLTEARAAASGLAARAGIKVVRSHASDEPEEKAKTRRLKKSPLSKPQLDKYRDILLLKRAEVAGDVSAMQTEVFNASETSFQADQGSEEYEQALSLGLVESQRRLLTQINEALSRINDGVYGICSITGGPIGRERLDATPWTTLSLDGAREQDRQNYYQ